MTRWLVALLAVVVVLAVAAAVLLRTGGDSGGPPAPRPPLAVDWRRAQPLGFDWIGARNRRFSEEELHKIATRFSLVVLDKAHAGANPGDEGADARALVALNPDLRVFPNLTTQFLPVKHLEDYRRLGFQDRWLLRYAAPLKDARAGEPIVRGEEGHKHSSYVDLASPEYRAWLLGVAARRLSAAPYAGIALDNFKRLDNTPERKAFWTRAIGSAHLRA